MAGFFRSVGVGYSHADDGKPFIPKSEQQPKLKGKTPGKDQIMSIRDLERVLGIKSEVKPQQQNNDGGWKSYTILRQKTKDGYIFYGTGRFKGLRVVSEEPIPPVMGEIFKGVDIFKAVRIKDIDCYNEGLHVRRED